jgi:glycosyltransferase involved in cell wall biosynthesis
VTVSYLVSSYNKSEYLPAVLKSVGRELASTGGDVLVIDDGSSDSSWSIIQEFGRHDPRITIKRQENRGIYNVTNQFIESGKQKWLRIVDCDDPPMMGSTELLVDIAEKNSADYVFGTMMPFGPAVLSDERAGQQQASPNTIETLSDPLSYAIRDYNHIPTAALIRQNAIPAATRLNESLVSCQDLALALPVFEHGRVVRIDVPVCHQLVKSEKRLSANEALTYFQTIQIIREFGAQRFDLKYKYMSARKIVSRAMRWMRRQRTIARSPGLYSRLSFLYGRLQFFYPNHWENYLNCAARAYADFIPAGRRPY